jgi:Ca2+/H+ antiporter
VGGIYHIEQQFHASVSEVGTGLLLVAGFGLLIPSAFYSALKSEVVREHVMGIVSKSKEYTQERLDHDILRISQITSIFLILAFVMYVALIHLCLDFLKAITNTRGTATSGSTRELNTPFSMRSWRRTRWVTQTEQPTCRSQN